jgi:hypothetical protein
MEASKKTWRDFMPSSVYLYYVDYRDSLDEFPELVNRCIVNNDLQPIDEEIFEWWPCPEQYYLDDIEKEMMNEGLHDEFIEHLDEIREWLWEHDESTPVSDLLRNTREISVYYDLGYEVSGWNDSWWGPSSRPNVNMDVHRVCQKLGIKKGTSDYDRVKTMVAQASYGGELRIYFPADLEQLVSKQMDDFKTIHFKGHFAVGIIDSVGGSGDFEYFDIDKKFPFVRENLIVSAMEKYSLEHIFGICGDWLRDVHHPEMTYTKSRAKVKKSGSAEKLSQEAKYIETFKAGGCTLGDTDMSRHRDVYYDNNFPCGHHCPHCGQFWVD